MSRAKKKRQIVVITTEGDAHIPFVQKHLEEPMIVLDSNSLVHRKTLTYEMINGRIRTVFNGLPLDNVHGVWFRKPTPIALDKIPLNKDYRAYAQDSLEAHYRSLYTAFPDALWMSDYYALIKACDKTWQLAIAQEVGFHVPATIVTSDTQRAKAFISEHDKVVMKTSTHFALTVDGIHKLLYTTLISNKKLPNLENLYVSPMIFQQAIDPLYDVRATVIGDKVFAASIRNAGLKPHTEVRDWRVGHFEGEIYTEPIENFPQDIADMCIAHTRKLGLAFGAVDLVADKKGKFWFLENNPNGQWGFIERLTGLPIGKAVAETLYCGK